MSERERRRDGNELGRADQRHSYRTRREREKIGWTFEESKLKLKDVMNGQEL